MFEEKHKEFWKFTLRFNLLLLGGLYFLLLIVATYMQIYRITHGDWFMNPIGIWIGLIYLTALITAFCTWVFCIWKSWRLTDFDHSYRVATMAYLFGAPAVLYVLSSDIMFGILYQMGIWVPMR